MSASPGDLVVLTYDHLLTHLTRARRSLGMTPRDQEQRSEALALSRAAVAELLAALDASRGGEIAHSLRSLYAFFLVELSTMGVSPNADRLERLTQMVKELRDAFATAAAQPAQVAS